MGQQSDFPYEAIDKISGNLLFTGDSTAQVEVTTKDSPHCWDGAALLCVPIGKFKADMPSQGLGSVQLPIWDQLGSENKKSRSRSNPIKINTAVADGLVESVDSMCMCRYDMATWQMYNRIVVHRLNCPVNLSQKVTPGESRQPSDNATLHCRSQSSDKGEFSLYEMVDPMPVSDSKDYLEEEVFEMEL